MRVAQVPPDSGAFGAFAIKTRPSCRYRFALSSAEGRTAYVAALRTATDAWLLDGAGVIHRQVDGDLPHPAVAFCDEDGGPYRPPRVPTGLARFGDEWLLADGTSVMTVFEHAEGPRRRIALPVPASAVFTAGDRVWIYDALPDWAARRLWFSRDLRAFFPSPLRFVSPGAPLRTQLLMGQAVFAGSEDGSFVYAHLLGAPVAVRVDAAGEEEAISLAYTRSRERATLLLSSPGQDPNRFSAPLRDLALFGADLYVLRNREDVCTPDGIALEEGRRVDRYASDGRHLATASLPRPARWLLRGDGCAVTVLAADGSVLVAPLGPPVPGAIIG